MYDFDEKKNGVTITKKIMNYTKLADTFNTYAQHETNEAFKRKY